MVKTIINSSKFKTIMGYQCRWITPWCFHSNNNSTTRFFKTNLILSNKLDCHKFNSLTKFSLTIPQVKTGVPTTNKIWDTIHTQINSKFNNINSLWGSRSISNSIQIRMNCQTIRVKILPTISSKINRTLLIQRIKIYLITLRSHQTNQWQQRTDQQKNVIFAHPRKLEINSQILAETLKCQKINLTQTSKINRNKDQTLTNTISLLMTACRFKSNKSKLFKSPN